MKRITHSSLLESGFDLVWSGSKNIYELSDDRGRFVRIGTHNDKNETGSYWVIYDADMTEDLKVTDFERLIKIVKQELNKEI